MEQCNTPFAATPSDETTSTTKRKRRSPSLDRSNGRIGEADFRNLSRREQLALANKFLMRPSNQFDDGTFKFSRSKLARICEGLGFVKGYIDPYPEDHISASKASISDDGVTIYIEHGRRPDVITKKFGLSPDTCKKMEELFTDSNGSALIPNQIRSKVIDVILNNTFDHLLSIQKAGLLHVFFLPLEEERLM